jgi:hypothetical protein
MNPNVFEVAMDVARQSNIKFHPELLKQFLTFRHNVWQTSVRKQAVLNNKPVPTLVDIGRIRQWVTQYDSEFNTLQPSRFNSLVTS